MMALVRAVIFSSIWVDVDVVGLRVDVDEHDLRARHLDRFGRRDEAVRDRDDLVAGPTPSALSAMKSASVPLATPTQCVTPQYRANASSNALTYGPADERRLVETAAIAASISGLIDWYWALQIHERNVLISAFSVCYHLHRDVPFER